MNKIPVALLLVVLAFSSCATQVGGSLRSDGGADLGVFGALEPRMAALITGFAAAAGIAPGTAILDGAAIAESMAAAPGIASVSLGNTSPVSIEGRVLVSHIGDFLYGGGAGFITFEPAAGGGGRFTASLDLDSGRDVLALISPDIANYLAALMAPVATGEVMSRDDYLFLVGAVYGTGIAEEISGATIRAWIDFPGPIQSVRGGTFSGSRAEFAIPLLDVLVLETPLHYEVVWR
ncbi:MAG: hypothetical protein FWB79_05695 [Treponema sp.]|nr:hypothetical protein [Treponema sp.]